MTGADVTGVRGMEGSGAGVLAWVMKDVSCDWADCDSEGVVSTGRESIVFKVVQPSIIDVWKAPYGPRLVPESSSIMRKRNVKISRPNKMTII